MNIIGEKSITVCPSKRRHTPHHRLTQYFKELDRQKAIPSGPNKTNNFGDNEPPDDDNNKRPRVTSEEKSNGFLAAFLASTLLAIGTNKLNAFASFGETVSDFINALLSGLSISLGALTLTKYLKAPPPEQSIEESSTKAGFPTNRNYSLN